MPLAMQFQDKQEAGRLKALGGDMLLAPPTSQGHQDPLSSPLNPLQVHVIT